MIKLQPKSTILATLNTYTKHFNNLYAETFRGPEHLAAIQEEARAIVAAAIGS
jgi:phosphoglucomutase